MIQLPITQGVVKHQVASTGEMCETWYQIVGNLDDPSVSSLPALIGLHGGPGAGHEYLSPLHDLFTRNSIPVITYDQVGCGRSTHFRHRMGDTSFWTLDLFHRELDALIDHLGLRARGFHLFGQSWGGILGATWASRRQSPAAAAAAAAAGLRKLVIASGPASMPLYSEGCHRLIAELPDDVRRAIEDGEREGCYDSPEFQRAEAVFYARHFCRMNPVPADVEAGLAHLKDDPTAYLTMCGPSEFSITGSLKDWSIGAEAAASIAVPTLLLNGRHDEAQDLCMAPWFRAIPRVRWATLEDASHMLHWEQRERCMELCADFLSFP